ncbi:MAG: sulfotransferase family protein [Planctomycetota bacterium]|jgi:hypothetical protein
MNAPDWYRAALDHAAAVAARQVLFVVGCQKSGTTWLQRLLDAHPAVRCDGEGHFSDVLGPLVQLAVQEYNQTPKATWALSNDDLFSAVRLLVDSQLARHLAAAPDPAAVRWLGDKTPEGALAVDLLDRLHPEARFVHCIRDGRDGAVSGWAHLARQGGEHRFASFAEYAEYFAAEHWRKYILAARQSAAARGGRVLEVRYEDLHADPRAETGRLLAFLDVVRDDATVAACVEAARFETLTGGRAPGEEDRASHFRKGVVGDWRECFDAEAARRFDAAAGDLIAELGYEPTGDVAAA